MSDLKVNKKVHLNYQTLETFEAGIVLTGAEVKSAKAGLLDLAGAQVAIDSRSQVWLKGLKIAHYPKAGWSPSAYTPDRPRRLLLHKKEVLKLRSQLDTAGLTIVPILVYTTRSLVKVKIALVRGKRKYDKRQTIREKEFRRRLNSQVRR